MKREFFQENTFLYLYEELYKNLIICKIINYDIYFRNLKELECKYLSKRFTT
jgi:hypothetical protein